MSRSPRSPQQLTPSSRDGNPAVDPLWALTMILAEIALRVEQDRAIEHGAGNKREDDPV